MGLTKKTKLILFALYWYYKEHNTRLKDTPLRLAISKVSFIDMVKKFQLAKKQPRALYKNLETLEKKKLISYRQKHLFLTDKGRKYIEKIMKDVEPYLNIIEEIRDKSSKVKVKRTETIFR